MGFCIEQRVIRWLTLKQRNLEEVYEMSREHEHPGLLLASVLKEKKIDPLDLAACTHLPFDSIMRILEGKQDINSVNPALIENCIGGDKPERWSGHQRTHNGWKARQP